MIRSVSSQTPLARDEVNDGPVHVNLGIRIKTASATGIRSAFRLNETTRARESLMISGTSKELASRFVAEAKIEALAAVASSNVAEYANSVLGHVHSETPVSCSM